MRYRVTAETKDLIEVLDHIGRRVESQLDRVSAEARQEWLKLLLQVPPHEDVLGGVVDLSTEELKEMIAKAIRFEQILKSARSRAPLALQRELALGVVELTDKVLN